MSSNLSAATKFKAHAFRMMMFAVLFMSAVLLMAYAVTSLMKAWPKFNIAVNLADNVQDSNDDDQKYEPPAEDDTMYPGGSEAESGILDSLAQYDRYNDVLRRVSKDTGLGERMTGETMKDRRIIGSDDDEWESSPFVMASSSLADSATMSREVTLFNL